MKIVARVKQNEGGSNYKQVDWEAFNKHKLEQIGEEEARVGVIVGMIDLGEHAKEMEYEYNPDNDYHVDLLESGRGLLSEVTEKGIDKTLITYAGGIKQQIAIMVEFPEIKIDYGKFFGEESDIKPYRVLLNKEFKGEISTLYSMTVDKKTKTFNSSSIFTTLAEATGRTDKVCTPEMDICALLGGVLTYQVGAKMDNGYLKEIVRAPTKPSKYIPIDEILKDYDIESALFAVSFLSGENDVEVLKELRWSVKKCIMRSPEYPESGIKKQFDELGISLPDSEVNKDSYTPTVEVVEDTPEIEELEEEDEPF